MDQYKDFKKNLLYTNEVELEKSKGKTTDEAIETGCQEISHKGPQDD